MASSTDRIHVTYPLRARRSRVWEAISDAGQFGFWFGAEFNGQFTVGRPLTGRIVPTRSHPGIGRAQKPYLGTTFEVSIDRVEPMCSFAFNWRPLTTASGESYLPEQETFVAFDLEETAGGTNLTITESGLNRNPLPVGVTPAAAGQSRTDEAISRGLWHPREIALLIEKFISGAVDLRPQRPSNRQ